jgi:hypothetical protein
MDGVAYHPTARTPYILNSQENTRSCSRYVTGKTIPHARSGNSVTRLTRKNRSIRPDTYPLHNLYTELPMDTQTVFARNAPNERMRGCV